MRLATDGDCVLPSSTRSESETLEKKIPDVLRVLAFTGTENPPKQFRDDEDSLSEDTYPLALIKAQPFEKTFGATWRFASAQNETIAPKARLPSDAAY